MKRVAIGLSLAFLGLSDVWAQSAAVLLSKYTLNPQPQGGAGWKMATGSTFEAPATRAWVNGISAGAGRISAVDAMIISGRAGALPVTVTTSVGLGEAATAIGRCLSLSAPVCAGAAAAAAVMYGGYRVYKGTHPELSVDPGAATIPRESYCYWAYDAVFCSGSEGAARSRAMALYFRPVVQDYQSSVHSLGVCRAVSTEMYYCDVSTTTTSTYRNPDGSTYQVVRNSIFENAFQGGRKDYQVRQICPASIDASNPALSIPEGRPPGADGKCETARYNHQPISPAEAAAQVVARPTGYAAPDLLQATRDAVQSGEKIGPSAVGITGPAAQTGPAHVTTQVNPAPRPVTTTTTTPTYHYTYAGDTISYTTTNVTNITEGDQTTIITDEPPPVPDPVDPCTVHPERVGCQVLGDAPPADALPRESRSASWVNVVFAAPATCPPDITFQAYGSRVISMGPLCELMVTLRPLFLALGAITAGFVFMGGFKL